MVKSFTVVIYVTVGLLLVVFLATNSPRRHHHHHRSPHSRRLKLRSSSPPATAGGGGAHPPIAFDPILSHIEQRREDREWEKTHFSFPHDNSSSVPVQESQPEWEDFYDAEDYINDEDRFNVTHRIELLFPQIDDGPADGLVTSDELAMWNLRQAEREVMHRTERDMELHDKNHDGFISFLEYEAPVWSRQLDDNTSDSKLGWWREDHFNASDVDGNELLNKTEFNDFLHPADSSNPKLIQWLCTEEIRERDKDKDGKLSFQEYFHGLFDSIRNYDEDHNQSDSSTAKKLFQQLDLDNDGLLSADELKAVIGKLHPSERFYAKQQADYVIQQVDTDSDGHLSLKEMIEHPYVFYSSIFNDDDDDEDDEDDHDEFR